jgi:ferredoxin-NADP reductase
MLPYVEELRQINATIAFTRHEDGVRPAGPPTRDEVLPLLDSAEVFYVCGSARFAEYAVPLLIDCGADPAAIRVEQFGATG